jgi:nucleotide-binding universal stress UspA family protein
MSWLPRKRVVVPYDFSDEAFQAISLGRQLVDGPENLYVVHVLPELTATEPGVIWATVDNASRLNHAHQAIEDKLTDYQGVQIKISFGDPGRVITDLAEEIGSDLIVIPSHGRTGMERILLGSVAERVVRLAHCPVLVLRK